MEKKSVRQATARGRRALVRVDFNVPLTDSGEVADDRRIVEALPTIHHLQTAGARTILLSHLGRPGGRRDPRYSLRPVARKLSALLGQPVPLAEDCVGMNALQATARLQNGGILMLENLRFHAGEEGNDPAFVQELAQLGELFVEEAFGAVHRAHASTVGLPQRMPSFCGLLVEKEVRELSHLREEPEHPYVALLGGAKVADKLPILNGLVGRADALLLGGALAFPFLAAQGKPLGASPTESGLESEVQALMARAGQNGTVLELPVDWLGERPGQKEVVACSADDVPSDVLLRDIGPRTRDRFYARLDGSASVFFNGPMGKAEDFRFTPGTREVLAGLATLAGYHVCAGGDSARIARDLGVEAAFQYVSTGGGAALEFVAGLDLPGLEALPDA
ncbi:MAG: phosphoglycerate kinase [Thermoplasmata archaeon]|nr:phosphoglycerate kinase [Thermoplasmata archaeon]MCI4337731.1 phosphoglycerate kinase [Thermoplasmata archaeon]